jgi:glutathione-regulated potassium-efflux system protein KefB
VCSSDLARGKADGFPVYYGDVADPTLWDAAGVERATLVVLTIDHPPTLLRAVSQLRHQYPHLPVVSRARDLESCSHLLQAGASYAFPEAVESSLRLGAQVLEMVGVPEENVDLLVTGVRRGNYSLVSEERSTPVGRQD